MGELIRNLQPIRIGSAELMIELNEGYTKNEGRLIHIQNKHFRYLLKEKNFLCMAATILRAKEEMDFYKSSKIQNQKKSIVHTVSELNGQEEIICSSMSKIMNKSDIAYRIFEIRPQIVTFIVSNSDYNKLCKVLADQSDIKELIHPYSEKLGYTYLYQMKPFKLFEYNGVFIEFYFQVPCMSLTEKTWIPLHKSIQERVWSVKEYNSEGNPVIDSLCYSIYRLCWAVFKNEYFTDYDVDIIKNSKERLNSEISEKLLEEVFFKFTKQMLHYINNDQYADIIPEYYKFTGY